MAEVTEYYDRRDNNNNNNNKNEDEISLLDLYFVLVRRKRTIIVTFVVVILMCAAYLILVPKVYQTSIMILPPLQSELTLTEAENTSLSSFKSKEVFENIQSKLKSKQVWNDFIKGNSVLFPASNKTSDNESVDNPLGFTVKKDFPGDNVVIQYDAKNLESLSKILNKYIMFSEKLYVTELIREERAIVKRKIISFESSIEFSRKKAKVTLDDEIAKLESNLKIARKLGISDNQLVTIKNPQALTVVTSDLKNPDYMRGVKVLTAVLEQLKQRHSNDAYIPDLRDKQLELQRLRSITFTPESFKPFQLDGESKKPVKIKPKGTLVLALGIVLGLMLGIFAAFFMEFIQKARSQSA